MKDYYHTGNWVSSMMLESASRLRLLAEENHKQHPFPFLVPSILVAFAAIETRINEVIHYKIIDQLQLSKKEFRKVVYKKLLFIKIEEKLLKFTKVLTDKTFDTKSPLWKSFKDLQNLRNNLMHYKLEGITDKEVNADKAKKAIKTIKQIMNALNLYYFGVKEDSYKLIKT